MGSGYVDSDVFANVPIGPVITAILPEIFIPATTEEAFVAAKHE